MAVKKMSIIKVRRLLSGMIVVLMLTLTTVSAFELPSFAAETTDQKVERILAGMSTDEKIAQMMVVSMPAEKATTIQKKYQFGGYILFARDFKNTNKKGMKNRIKSCQSSSKIPMLMAVDEEGGTVVRASLYKKYRKSRFKSPRQVYKYRGYKGIIKDTKNKDVFLKSLGLNTNFGPVADVPYKKTNFMYNRAFSTNASKTSKFVKVSVKQMGKDKVVSAVKHFPGYGKNGDTHGKIIRDKRSKATFVTRDLRPFNAGISAGADMIMVSHTIVNAFDKKNPASLSPKVNTYIRKNMKFNGVTITDGLGMKGVTDFVGGDQGRAAVRAVKAGNDMLCVTGNYNKCYKALKAAAQSGEISKTQINKSVRRILRMKIKRGIIK